MVKHFAVAVLAGTLGLAGCANTDAPNKSTASKDEGEVVTGSRIARKNETTQSVKNVSKDEFTRDSKVMATPGKGG
jgi:outer membrane lipoprotein SlyB